MIVLDGLVWILKIIPTTLIVVGSSLDMPISYLGSLSSDGGDIIEPLHVVSGHRYASLKIDLPLTDRNLWYYAGDEAERAGTVDEGTYTLRISDFADTKNLDGHETGENCFRSHAY